MMDKWTTSKFQQAMATLCKNSFATIIKHSLHVMNVCYTYRFYRNPVHSVDQFCWRQTV